MEFNEMNLYRKIYLSLSLILRDFLFARNCNSFGVVKCNTGLVEGKFLNFVQSCNEFKSFKNIFAYLTNTGCDMGKGISIF